MTKLISKKDRIFIAGANGLVGNSIYRKLIELGYGTSENINRILIPNRTDLDLLDLNKVRYWFKVNNPKVVIIAAAKVGGIFANHNKPADFILENLIIQNNIIKTAFESDVNRLLFLGSSCIYPKLCPQPIKEEYLLTDSLEETNQWYAIAKISGIKLCEALRIQYNFDAISLMPTNLYGPGDNYHPTDSHVLPALISKFYKAKKNKDNEVICWGDGSPLREFMHVDDLADACIFVLENWDPSDSKSPKDKDGKPLTFLNVGTGKDISIKELTTIISKYIGYEGDIIWDKNKPNGTPKKQLNIDKINSLGWKAKIDLKDGIKRTINEYINNIK
tara:strand:+ start:27 stop:1025 length:999 start_codon:yes stop_codon:yes gene_type:complete